MSGPLLLVAGGQSDPNLQALMRAARLAGVDLIDLCLPPDHSPAFHWDLDLSAASGPVAMPWGGARCPQGAFLRQDVFAPMADPRPAVHERAAGWYAAVQGWVMAHAQVRTVNADMAPVAFNKPAAQMAARRVGLRTPPTWVSNDTARMRARLSSPAIAKPVAGGGLCQTLAAALQGIDVAHSAMPALVQPQLRAPELRVFVIGDQTLAFTVDSPSLDYRAQQDATVTPCPVPAEAEALRHLMTEFRMTFGAADFKTDPDTGALCFLELNTSPMFAHFDQVSEGAVCRALLHYLLCGG